MGILPSLTLNVCVIFSPAARNVVTFSEIFYVVTIWYVRSGFIEFVTVATNF